MDEVGKSVRHRDVSGTPVTIDRATGIVHWSIGTRYYRLTKAGVLYDATDADCAVVIWMTTRLETAVAVTVGIDMGWLWCERHHDVERMKRDSERSTRRKE